MNVCKLSLHFQVWTRKYSHTLKAESYLVGMFWTPSPGDSISVALRKLLQRDKRESQAIHKFETKGSGSLNKQRPGITEFTPFICTSAIWNQSCFPVHFVSYSSCLLKTQKIFSFHTFRVQLSAIPQSMEFSRPEYWSG